MELIPAIPAPEFKKITDWANSQPLSINALKGKVVLIDCWTYTCIFVSWTIPTMRRLQQKYGKYGLQVVQAHSAEYPLLPTKPTSGALSRYNITDVPVGHLTPTTDMGSLWQYVLAKTYLCRSQWIYPL